MADDKETSVSSSEQVKRKRVRRSSVQRKPVTAKTEFELIEESFAQLAPEGEQLAVRFYERLFHDHPDLEPLFEGISIVGQQKKLLASLVLLVQNLRKPDVLNDYLSGLGARHTHYGVTSEDYPKFADSLIAVMAEMLGDKWSSPLAMAWKNMFNEVTRLMLDTHPSKEEKPVAQTTVTSEDNVDVAISARDIVSALDGAVTAVMMVDRDLNIIYANQATINMLAEHEDVLREEFPGFSVKTLLGSNIDVFHKNPQHQRQLLKDPNNLPYSADIRVGPLAFRLNVSARWSDQGDYIGNMLEWHNVTEEKEHNADINGQFDALNKVMSVISFDLDGTIIDVNDNFIDVIGYSRDELLGQSHAIFIDPEYVASQQYEDFWEQLNQGGVYTGEYKRIAKDGSEVWLQAIYTPIFDLTGKPYKVVKFATNTTAQKVLQRTVEQALSSVSIVMHAMSAGDMTKRFEGQYQGDFAELQESVNTTIEKIAAIVRDINDAATNISNAASEISQGNMDLSQRTEKQASSLEATASSMEQLTSAVRHNSDHANQANQLASNARQQAERGGMVIKDAIDAMSAISASSKKVADIISVIDDIAFQTNLLALNAAVEAARAGDQGRGFAVVASEVRNLAQRSAAAAKEIKELISDSSEKVKEGALLVDESGRTLEDIVASAKKVGDIIAEIAAAGEEQRSGIEQINKTVIQMDEMTQQNASLVEQAAAASESLDDQGKNLKAMMAFFNIGMPVAEESTIPISKPVAPLAADEVSLNEDMSNIAVQTDDDEWDEF